jgi:hypothetical protein
MYYRQLDELSITVCIAQKLSDEDWLGYLEGGHAVTRKAGRPPTASVIWCMHAFPSARQRQMSNDFMTLHFKQRPMLRAAIMTESAVIRSAMSAMRWLIPSLTLRAFVPGQIAPAVQWLREVATFEVPDALDAWSDAMTKLAIRTRTGKKGA